MLQIRALNEDLEDSYSTTEEELTVTGEAEETIAVSEYLKALNFKNSNQPDTALFLFLELLDTELLNKVSDDNKDSKICLVKYNCFRNAGLIYQEMGQDSLALDFLIKAVELDNRDVHTMFFLAKLALKMGQIQVAKEYYEKCIERNPNHWPSLDGLLQVFCASENVIEAFSWAMHCVAKDNMYKRANDVLAEIQDRFSSTVPFLEELFGCSAKLHATGIKYWDECSTSFYAYTSLNHDLIQPKIDFETFKVQNLNWLALGELIVQLHKSTGALDQEFLFMFKLDDFIGPQVKLNSPCSNLEDEIQTLEADPTATVIENAFSKNADISTDSEFKSRRRGSELKILEQWGWHKNRRSSRKKSVFDASDPIESTADGFLKRALSKYFGVSYETGVSPFSEIAYESTTKSTKHPENAPMCVEQFDELSQIGFDALISELQRSDFDIYIFIHRYLHYLSLYWSDCMPQALRTMYLQLYNLFNKYEHCQSWNQLSDSDISAMFRMAIFYLELQFDCIEKDATDVKSQIEWEFRNILSNLQLYASHLPDKDYVLYQARYLWLNYGIYIYENDMCAALNKLEQIEKLITEESETLCVRLLNQRFNNFFNLSFIQDSIISLNRKINLSSVKKLYNEQNYHELVHILKNSLMNVTETQPADNRYINISTQIEILLECLWCLEQYLDCVVWAEKALKYTMDLFLSLPNDSFRQIGCAKTINFILVYIQSVVETEGSDILQFEYFPRLVQSIHTILTNLLDTPLDKHVSLQYTIDCWKAWAILYYILERQDDKSMIYRKNRTSTNETFISEIESETLFSSITMFFVAHELLGRRQWCSKGGNKLLFMTLDVIVPKLRCPMFEPYRDIIKECLEQTTYCLYGYPLKKGRMRHIQDHDATPVQLTWEKAIQLFDIFRPDVLPEFNSYKIDSISADMEALLQHILSVLPETYDVSQQTGPITEFINGNESILPMAPGNDLLCFKIRTIYYLLADYYFKSRDFTKAIKYYVMDLTIEPTRFDSWAGISLSKASKCETMLNSTEVLRPKEFIGEANNAIKCFEQCLKLNECDAQLWVEYGSFAYNVHSYCSRSLKMQSNTLSIDGFGLVETQQARYVNIAYKSFNMVNVEPNNGDLKEKHDVQEAGGHEDEKWLYHYMLGKIAEKKKQEPVIYLTHYLKSAKFLYESNATYPIKVNHSNPSQLSVEALEVFYRTNAAIIKYTEQRLSICKQTAVLFKQILNELALSPFAVNRAKINDVSFKRKLTETVEQTVVQQSKIDITTIVLSEDEAQEVERIDNVSNVSVDVEQQAHKERIGETTVERIFFEPNNAKDEGPSRRVSQESTAATNTTITSTSNGTSSASSGSDSPNSGQDFSSDSDSDSSTDDEAPISSVDRDSIFKDCVKNLEECVTRFPEHYKSIYRLAYHYINAPGETKSLDRSRELLLGSYKTALGNQIAGLFTEKRSNNFFNGIWRIPSSDIDRPGSFASHLSKCVAVLIETLKQSNDHETLLDLAIQLYRKPDADKKYLNDYDRKELFQQAILICIQVYQNILKSLATPINDSEILSLLVEIFKAYRKCVKHMQHKEGIFSAVLVEAYKVFIHDKAKLPENFNVLDLAVKLCTYEINYRKTMEKIACGSKPVNPGTETATTIITPMQPISACYIPGLTKLRRTTGNKPHSNTVTATVPSVGPATKYIPTGPPTIVSASLPGLTITPVNVSNSMVQDHQLTTSCHPISSAPLQSSTSSLFANYSNPKVIAELSKMYFNSFANTNIKDISFDYNRLLAEATMSSRVETDSIAEVLPPKTKAIQPATEGADNDHMNS